MKTNRADHPRERLTVTPMPSRQPEGTPFKVYVRTDGKAIVYDERRPPGARAVWEGDSVDAAMAAAYRIHESR